MPSPAVRNTILRPRAPDIFPGSYAVGGGLLHSEHYSPRLETGSSHSLSPTAQNDSMAAEPSRREERKTDGEHVPRDALLLSPSDGWKTAVKDCFDYRLWMDPVLWSAGLVEFSASIAFTFITGAIGVTISSYPIYVLGPAIFVGNTAAVSLFIYALSTASGAHLNPLISMATMFAGLCHPVRSMVYVICQVAGSIIGGAFLRAGLGHERALAVHNGGCFLDPNGPVTVGQASAIEFMAAFSLLLIAFGVGLDPRQKSLYSASLGPLLVGLTVGLMTAATSALNEGYTGAGLFPGRCLGLQIGVGQIYSHDWVWWLPDIAAAIFHAVLYRAVPPYVKEREE